MSVESCQTPHIPKNGKRVDAQFGGEMVENLDCYWDMLFVSC